MLNCAVSSRTGLISHGSTTNDNVNHMQGNFYFVKYFLLNRDYIKLFGSVFNVIMMYSSRGSFPSHDEMRCIIICNSRMYFIIFRNILYVQ